ncbi:unnamed protein product [Nezara viridula]|uniref:Uncharacterized protein n=1 Tax=Nezara viridula TaxID=85310 RepID=A0A9P0H3K4_NEZVI|nr:unnamed protein product [Nezara viridula]
MIVGNRTSSDGKIIFAFIRRNLTTEEMYLCAVSRSHLSFTASCILKPQSSGPPPRIREKKLEEEEFAKRREAIRPQRSPSTPQPL